MSEDITRPRIVENARRAYLDTCAERRIAFKHETTEYFNKFCHEHNFRGRWPGEALRLAQAEVKLRNQTLESKLREAIGAGWKPSPMFSVDQALNRCFSHDNHDEDPSSDLFEFVLGAFDRVGRPKSDEEDREQRIGLGDTQVRGRNMLVQTLDALATAKYGDYRKLDYNEKTRLDALRALNDHFPKGGDHIIPIGLLELLGVENNDSNRRVAGLILKYWIDDKSLVGKSLKTDDGSIHAQATEITPRGTQIAEGRSGSGSIVNHTAYHISNSTVGVAGNMTGGTVILTGSNSSGLIEALDALRAAASSSESPQAVVIEATAERAVNELKSEAPDEGKVVKYLVGAGEVVRTLGEFGPAWALVSAAAAAAGIHLPALPGH